jgi:hypothetical protein
MSEINIQFRTDFNLTKTINGYMVHPSYRKENYFMPDEVYTFENFESLVAFLEEWRDMEPEK